MAIFGGKKKEEKEKADKVASDKAEKETKSAAPAKQAPNKSKNVLAPKKKLRRQITRQNMALEHSRVLLRPRITEKATDVTANRTYVFEVAVDATKKDVSEAVKEYYKVTPVKVNVVKIPSKKRRNRNRRTFGRSAVGKKAYVYLKEGDSIEFV